MLLSSIDLNMLAFTELPYHLPGRVYRSVMPYGSYDPEGVLLDRYQSEQISMVVVLAEVSEIVRISGRDLVSLYLEQDWRLLHMPIKDFAVPEIKLLKDAVAETIQAAAAGQNVAIHCSAGIGRTGLFAACMARQALGMTGEQAIAWVRRFIPYAVETEGQRKLVIDY